MQPTEQAKQPNSMELSDWDRTMFTYFGKRSAVVPLGQSNLAPETNLRTPSEFACFSGCVLTAGILASGFYHFKKGNKRTSNIMMRARVAAQAVTVGCMMFSINVTKRQKELGIEV